MSEATAQKRYVTRKAGVDEVRKTGIPLTLSAVEKAAHRGDGPPVAARFGKQLLYDPASFIAWAQQRVELLSAEEPRAA